MKRIDALKEDYKKHGYSLISEKNGVLVFDTDSDFYQKNVKTEIHKTHPIFTDKFGKQVGNKSTCIVHNMCGHCKVHLIGDTCPICKRKYKIKIRKPHIPYPEEANGQL
jgi:hypothetical protein